MPGNKRAHSGALKIVDTCLQLATPDELLVLFDETSRDVAHLFVETAYDAGVHAAAIYVPRSVQRWLGQQQVLPLSIHQAIREAAGLLTCLTDDNACLAFRRKVFDVALNVKGKIGHMPGVRMKILPMADVDYGQIRADCDILAAALLRGKRLDLITHDSKGLEYRLSTDIGGWDRPPAISNGLIGRGSWANLPAGETFIAPVEETANGTVVIDGSLPGYVIPLGSEVRLEFINGRLVAYHSPDPRCLEIIAGLRDFALRQGDPNWSNLAEIGLGVNPAVRNLTGVELLDEKKYGTAHVALGESDWFGGTVSSVIHNDLIIRSPTVEVDGHTLVRRGQIEALWADWQEDHHALEVSDAWQAGFSTLTRTATRGDRGLGMLRRQWVDGRGELRYLQVGPSESARKAAYLYAQIPAFDGHIEAKTLLAHNPSLDEHEVYQLLRLMEIYELVKLT